MTLRAIICPNCYHLVGLSENGFDLELCTLCGMILMEDASPYACHMLTQDEWLGLDPGIQGIIQKHRYLASQRPPIAIYPIMIGCWSTLISMN